MQTLDGRTVTKIEQEGEYAGEDIGRLWISTPTGWTWYGCGNAAVQQTYFEKAQTMTATAFDEWWDTDLD